MHLLTFVLAIVVILSPGATTPLQPPEPLTVENLVSYQQTLDLLYPDTSHISYNVERWRPFVEKYFAPTDVDTAMQIMQCESGGDPNAKNPRSSASGLFQHLARYWPTRSASAGWTGASIWNPEANVAVAAWLKDTAGWGSWTCY